METYRFETHEVKELAASGLYRDLFTDREQWAPRRLINVIFHLGFIEKVDCRDFCTPALLSQLANIHDESMVRWMMRLLPAKPLKNSGDEYWKITDWSLVTDYWSGRTVSFQAVCNEENAKEKAEVQQKAQEIYEFPNGTFSSLRQVAKALNTGNLQTAAKYLRDNNIIKNAEGFYVKSTDPSASMTFSDATTVESRITTALSKQEFHAIVDLAVFVDASMAQTSKICKRLGIVKAPDTGLLVQSKGTH